MFHNIATKYFKDARILYCADEIITVLPATASFKDFTNDTKANFIVMIEVKKRDKISTNESDFIKINIENYKITRNKIIIDINQ